MLPNHDTIENMTLRWRGQADQAYVPATQMRVERRFSELDFSPPGLPPNAVLFIRSVRSLSTLASLDFIPQNWETEIRQQIEAYYRQAVHPVRGFIPTAVESIIFTDYAEVIAALTSAVIAGQWWNQWPWVEIIPMIQPSAALSTAWIKYIQYLPAAFSLLTPAQIVTAVHLLTPTATNRIIQELRSVFALPEPAITQPPANISPTISVSNSQIAAIEPPWTVWLPPSLSQSDLSLQESYLVGLVIGLNHSPAYVRSQSFTFQTAHWLSTRPAQQSAEQPRRVIITTRPCEEEAPQASNPSQLDSATLTVDEAIDEEEAPQASSPTQRTDANITVDEPKISGESVLELLPDETVNLTVPFDGGQWTHYAGILYLINLLGWLGMPQDWDEALTRHLSTWGLVEILARALLSDASLNSNDPILAILAKLDKRDLNEIIAPDFPSRSSFRLPANLLRRFAPKHPHWRVALIEDRLRLLDDTDLYLIAEQTLDGQEPSMIVEALLADYAGQGIQATWAFGDNQSDESLSLFVTQICNPALQMWLGRTMGFVRYWLRAIADLDPQEMLHILGRISVTYTHVDLFMSMETVDIRVRKVGLDRNPGWMPDFGYIILFHFDE